MKRIAVVLCLLLVACGGDNDEPSAATTTNSTEAPTVVTSTTSAFSTSAVSTPEATEQGQLTNVTTGTHDGFVRVVFTFSNLVPGYSVTPAEPPFVQDGSGEEVTVRGSGHLAVRLTARAHDDDGKSSAPVSIVGPESDPLREVRRLGDFEGVVNYVIGLDEPRPFKVFTLSSPHRLVIDIKSA